MNRFDICLLSLSADASKTRPCVILSPDEMNRHLRTVIIAPVTEKTIESPSQIAFTFKRKASAIVLDQLGTVLKAQLVKKLGSLPEDTARMVSERLIEMFEY